MDDEPLPLTSLCAICHVNPLKYTCPRCGIHTCSLPCVKLHKKRAQCSGIRNPGEYTRRSELATPSGFDRDFNFITGLERGLQKAEDVLAERKIDLRPAATLRGWRGAVTLDKAAEERGVSLIRAPIGLNRRSENKSKVGGKEGNVLVWTVEWISWNGKRRVQNFDERKTLGDAYAMCHPTTTGRKRKREGEDEEGGGGGAVGQGKKEIAEHGSHEKEKQELPSSVINGGSSSLSPAPQHLSSQVNAPGGEEGPESKEQSATHHATKSNPVPDHIHLYLHRPQTTSKIKCLIPLSTTDTIKDALQGKRIVEFPTIYVRNEPPEQLPLPLILESKYLEQYGEDIGVQGQPQNSPRDFTRLISLDSIDSQTT